MKEMVEVLQQALHPFYIDPETLVVKVDSHFMAKSIKFALKDNATNWVIPCTLSLEREERKVPVCTGFSFVSSISFISSVCFILKCLCIDAKTKKKRQFCKKTRVHRSLPSWRKEEEKKAPGQLDSCWLFGQVCSRCHAVAASEFFFLFLSVCHLELLCHFLLGQRTSTCIWFLHSALSLWGLNWGKHPSLGID